MFEIHTNEFRFFIVASKMSGVQFGCLLELANALNAFIKGRRLVTISRITLSDDDCVYSVSCEIFVARKENNTSDSYCLPAEVFLGLEAICGPILKETSLEPKDVPTIADINQALGCPQLQGGSFGGFSLR